jgi:cytoskeletal protein CcmA (bactofilin family)
LPPAGVKRGYIEGKSFEGATLINGVIQNSKNELPPLDKSMIKNLSDAFALNSFQSGLYKEIVMEGKDTLINSFLDTTILIRAGRTISNKYLSGNIVVWADSSLVIDQSAKLEDILIFAGSIKIKKGFEGNIQAFARDSIVVEENCKLNYPSALGLFKKDHKTQQPYIRLMKNSEMNGIVFSSQSEFVSDQSQTLVSIDKQALLKGQLYVDGFADIKGEVRGSVWCNKFLLKTPSSIYENHLLDAVIDRSKLSSYYVGSALIAAGKRKKVIKWMN